jgi:hypothetical protein
MNVPFFIEEGTAFITLSLMQLAFDVHASYGVVENTDTVRTQPSSLTMQTQLQRAQIQIKNE